MSQLRVNIRYSATASNSAVVLTYLTAHVRTRELRAPVIGPGGGALLLVETQAGSGRGPEGTTVLRSNDHLHVATRS